MYFWMAFYSIAQEIKRLETMLVFCFLLSDEKKRTFKKILIPIKTSKFLEFSF